MARRHGGTVSTTWNIGDAVVTYHYPSRNDRPGMFTCSMHGAQRERKIERWIYAPDSACEHVLKLGRSNGFWSD